MQINPDTVATVLVCYSKKGASTYLLEVNACRRVFSVVMTFGEDQGMEKWPLQLSETVCWSVTMHLSFTGDANVLVTLSKHKTQENMAYFCFLMVLDDMFVCICGNEMHFSSTAVG